MQYLSKSDYKVARDCITKLYYKKHNYLSLDNDDEYLQLLAEQGYQVGKLAQVLYPDGIEITGSIEECLNQTQILLQQDNIILFEATFLYNNQLTRVDILEKSGNSINIIEVKAKSIDTSKKKDINDIFLTKKGVVRSKWTPYLEDITFQYNLIQQLYKEWQIDCYIYLPDKSEKCLIDNLLEYLPITYTNNKYIVEYTGSREWLQNMQFLKRININIPVQILSNEVQDYTNIFLKTLNANNNTFERAQGALTSKCMKCNYRTEDINSGFIECWNPKFADINLQDSTVLDLSYFGNWKGNQEVIDSGYLELTNILDHETIFDGKHGLRRQIQVQHTLDNTEYIDYERLGQQFDQLVYPLHFIDFETYQSPIPLHKNTAPFHKIAFQWSCHTLDTPESKPVHREFLNTSKTYPNIKFVESLREYIGNTGTILIWSSYENTILRDIYNELPDGSDLKDWLYNNIRLDSDSDDVMTDIHKWCEKYYFHPLMKGRTSIKYVLAAIWTNNKWLHNIDWLQQYVKYDNNQNILSPYKTLDNNNSSSEQTGVHNGTEAMKAYINMLYRPNVNTQTQSELAYMLREYCKLDTLAMVIIFRYWYEQCKQKLRVCTARSN